MASSSVLTLRTMWEAVAEGDQGFLNQYGTKKAEAARRLGSKNECLILTLQLAVHAGLIVPRD